MSNLVKLPQHHTSVSQWLLRDEFLQTRPQLNLNSIMSVSAIIHQHEVSVIDIEAGEKALTLLVQSIVRRETTLEKTEDDIPETLCYKITISITKLQGVCELMKS